MGRPWSHLSCFWPFWLPLAWPRRRRRPKRSLRGRFWEPSWLQQSFFYDLLGSPRGVFFITLSNLFLQQNCSENRDQRVLRVKSAQHGHTVKQKSFFQDFRSSQDRRAHSKQAHREETNVLKTIINKQGKQAQHLIFRHFRLALQTYPQNGVPEPPREPPGTAPGLSLIHI